MEQINIIYKSFFKNSKIEGLQPCLSAFKIVNILFLNTGSDGANFANSGNALYVRGAFKLKDAFDILVCLTLTCNLGLVL